MIKSNQGQFHQPIGTKCKCDGARSLVQKMPFSFTNKTAPNLNSINNWKSHICALHSMPGMHKIQPAGQMWPAEAFNLASTAIFFCSFTLFVCKKKNPLTLKKHIIFGPCILKKKFLARQEIWVVHPCSMLCTRKISIDLLGAQAASKMMMKLTQGFSLIKIKPLKDDN